MFGLGRSLGQNLFYSLGDMRSKEGSSLYWEMDQLATEVSLRIAGQITSTQPYKILTTLLPPEKVALYYEKQIKEAIYVPIRDLCVIQWHIRNHQPLKRSEVYWSDHRWFGAALQKFWPSKEIPLKIGSPMMASTATRLYLRYLLRVVRRVTGRLKRVSAGSQLPLRPIIAVHYREGVDLSRRSDLYWYPESGVDPKRVLIVFDGHYPNGKLPVAESVLRQIEEFGMRWLCMETGRVEKNNSSVWQPGSEYPLIRREIKKLGEKLMTSYCPDRWVTETAKSLLQEIDYWGSFYQHFNVKIHFEMEEGYTRNIAQNITLDLLNGIHVGKQRSQISCQEFAPYGFYPRHVFFSWNKQVSSNLKDSRSRIEYVVVSGFPNDSLFRRHAKLNDKTREEFSGRGARFIVALFDNGYGPDAYLSKRMMESFYIYFLKWVLEDREVGLLIKSKKPGVIKDLEGMHEMLAKAEKTGRCVTIPDIMGRLPSDTSQAADMSVGIGISSAVMEAAIAGGKGIQWDPSGVRPHLFHSWGYGKVIFEDLDKLMTALRRYKADPLSEPGLGDFSPILGRLDPFRDGGAGERVGTYICWLLEAFDAGCDRDGAIQQANRKYAELWGADKIIRLVKGSGTVEAHGRPDGSAAREIPHAKFPSATGWERP